MEGLSIFGISLLIPGFLALAALLAALALYSWGRQRRIATEAGKMAAQKLSPDDELTTLGIVSVRRLEEQESEQESDLTGKSSGDDSVRLSFLKEGSRRTRKPSTKVDDAIGDLAIKSDADSRGARFSPERWRTASQSASSDVLGRHPGTYLNENTRLWNSSDPASSPDAVASLLESLWAAMQAQNIALLRFDETTSSYAVDALVRDRVAGQINLFPASGTALDHVFDSTSISILEPDSFSELRYHENPEGSVGHAIAIAINGASERLLLVADVEPGEDSFGTVRLERFGAYAAILGGLLPDGSEERRDTVREKKKPARTASSRSAKKSTPKPSAVAQPADEKMYESAPDALREEDAPDSNFELDVDAIKEERPPVKVPVFDPPDGSNGSNRPRNEIIAEEMAAARATEEPLALALVVPYDAVELATKGARVVRRAEEELMERLRAVPGSKRIEMFGELVIGVFCKAGPAFVEAWVERVEDSGPDVHIGVALMRARHRTSEAFRADAERALREAYERQEECVIVD